MSLQTVQTKGSKTDQKEDSTTPSARRQGSEQATDKTAIRPFRVNVPEAALAGLHRRVASTRLPERREAEMLGLLAHAVAHRKPF